MPFFQQVLLNFHQAGSTLHERPMAPGDVTGPTQLHGTKKGGPVPPFNLCRGHGSSWVEGHSRHGGLCPAEVAAFILGPYHVSGMVPRLTHQGTLSFDPHDKLIMQAPLMAPFLRRETGRAGTSDGLPAVSWPVSSRAGPGTQAPWTPPECSTPPWDGSVGPVEWRMASLSLAVTQARASPCDLD